MVDVYRFVCSFALITAVVSSDKLNEGDKASAKHEISRRTLNNIETAYKNGPGIEYAPAQVEDQQITSPAVELDSSSPQPAKISDVLSGQGPGFPTAIADHLVSPFTAYQTLAKTQYAISAPIPSRLAYSENKIMYRAPRLQQLNGLSPESQKELPQSRQFLQLPLQQVFEQPSLFLPPNPQTDQSQPQGFYPQFNGLQGFTIQHNVGQVPVPQGVQQPRYVTGQSGSVSHASFTAPGVQIIKSNELDVQNIDDRRRQNDFQFSQPQTGPSAAVSYASFSQSQPAVGPLPTNTIQTSINNHIPYPHNPPAYQQPLNLQRTNVNYIPLSQPHNQYQQSLPFNVYQQPYQSRFTLSHQQPLQQAYQPQLINHQLPLNQARFQDPLQVQSIVQKQTPFYQSGYDNGYLRNSVHNFPAVQYFGNFKHNLVK